MKHKHHIVPRHAGGSDDPSNLIELTVEEHAEAHRLLYEEFGRWEDNIAHLALSGQIDMDEASRMAVLEGARKGGNSNKTNKTGFCGRTQDKMSEDGKKGALASSVFKDSNFQKEMATRSNAKLKIDRENNPDKWELIDQKRGIAIKETVNQKIAMGTYENSGLIDSERGKKMAEKNNGHSTCPHCNKSGQYRAMKRWHFENCKVITSIQEK